MAQTQYIEDGGQLQRPAAEAGKKNVLLIGDSIRMGYCKTVKTLLADAANVFYPEENCRSTQYTIMSLLTWSSLCDREAVDLVHFNCGHWDAAHWNGEPVSLTPAAVYAENIRRIVWQLRKLFPNARIAFATTTPMNPNGQVGVNPRSTEEIRAYNEAALEVLRGLDVEVDDLFAAAEGWDETWYADYCHPKAEGFAELGVVVAGFLRKLL